jgi:succinate dehydrogenase membrane anchor subunit
MVKSVLGVAHSGLRDWLIQRLSALLMAVYLIGLVSYLLTHPGISFAEWHHLFAQNWLKVLTILVLLSMLWHAWVGMWTIFTDYIKSSVVRLILHTIVFFLLAAFFIWGVMILWSV